ncbi:MAG: hypothetical protein AAGK14_14140 [Verrucomicrobiota bacterium]
MAALPDWFDLWVRRARELPGDGVRQLELLLGAVFTLPEVFLWNVGTVEAPVPAIGEDESGIRLLLLFTHEHKLIELVEEHSSGAGVPAIAMPPVQVGGFLQDLSAESGEIAGVLVNPGDFAFQVERRAWEDFSQAWTRRDPAERQAAQGFWIPKMTGEEEDFWQEHGL